MNGIFFFYSNPEDRWSQAIAGYLHDDLTHVGLYVDGCFYEQALNGFTTTKCSLGVPLSSPHLAAFVSWKNLGIPHLRPSTIRDYVAWGKGNVANVCTDWAQRGMGIPRPTRKTPRQLLEFVNEQALRKGEAGSSTQLVKRLVSNEV